MDIVEEILAAIEDGISPKEIASQLTWESLAEYEREQLLATARNLGGSQHGYELLVLLYTLSQDDWFTARVLGYVVGHPSLAQDERQNTLKTLRRLLDKTRAHLAGRPEADQKLRWQQLYEAGYLALSAQVSEEAGRLDEALENYRKALVIYRELGFTRAAVRLEQSIQANLTTRPPLKTTPAAAPASLPRSSRPPAHTGARPLVPPGGIPDRPAAPPQTESNKLAAQIKAQAQTLTELIAKTKEKQEQHDRLLREIAVLEQKANQTEKERSAQLLEKLRLSESRPAPKTPASPQAEISQELEELKSQLSEAREEEQQLEQRIQQKQVRLEKLESEIHAGTIEKQKREKNV